MDDQTNGNGGSITVAAPAMPVAQTAGTAIESSRAVAEIQAAFLVAKQFPRDVIRATQAIVDACKDAKLAKQAEYSYPKGGKRVNGPSIRLAEVEAQHWGNFRAGFHELARGPGFSEVRSFALDLETNACFERVFTVRHIIDRQEGGRETRDEREVYELIANQAQRRVRACVLNMIPGNVTDQALDQVHKTLTVDSPEPLAERVRKVIAAFKSRYGVTPEQWEVRFGCNVNAFNERNYLEMVSIGNSLKDGMSTVEHWFSRVGDLEALKARMEAAKSKNGAEEEPGKNVAVNAETGEVIEDPLTGQSPAGSEVSAGISDEDRALITFTSEKSSNFKTQYAPILEKLEAQYGARGAFRIVMNALGVAGAVNVTELAAGERKTFVQALEAKLEVTPAGEVEDE